jgi:hypothetical protein
VVVVDVHARGSLIKKTTEVVLLRGRRRVHWKGSTLLLPLPLPLLAPAAPLSPRRQRASFSLTPNQVPYPRLRTTLLQALRDFPREDNSAHPTQSWTSKALPFQSQALPMAESQGNPGNTQSLPQFVHTSSRLLNRGASTIGWRKPAKHRL